MPIACLVSVLRLEAGATLIDDGNKRVGNNDKDAISRQQLRVNLPRAFP
jgi:hypothetical protein